MCSMSKHMNDLFQENSCETIEKKIVPVLVPYPVDKAYSYVVPEDMELSKGDYVLVPLGGRDVIGVVWDSEVDNIPKNKLKEIIYKFPVNPMPKVHREFIKWVAGYVMSPVGAVLKMAVSVVAALDKPKPVTGYVINVEEDNEKLKAGLSPKGMRVLEILSDGIPRRASEIVRLAECSSSVIKTMCKKYFIRQVDMYSNPPCIYPDLSIKGAELSAEQEKAAKKISEHVDADKNIISLLDGVTGAGKTEVYFEAVHPALEKGKQVLILVPEISLSNAFLGRFKSRFGCAPALWHSSLSQAQRRITWRGIAQGKSKVVIGARSALFLPYKNLGLIVVDEEHEGAYKQEDGVMYNARDMAVVRGHLGKFPVILVSATPSLESLLNAWHGKYEHLHLPNRHGGAEMPEINLIDLRVDKPERQHFLSPPLKKALAENFKAREQSLLFLNRRGYAPLTICRSCGYRVNCPRCTSWLVEHRSLRKLECHHCGYMLPYPEKCPECEDMNSLSPCGPGVERIVEEVKEYMPQANIVMLASDSAMTHDELKKILDDIRDEKYDVIVGTQIIAKGHHFPKLTLVGVVDADLGLSGGDLRATERTYQLLHQVAGRAGRAEHKGRVFLQSWSPENRVMQALATGDRDNFLEVEALEREEAEMPPYTRLVAIIISGIDEGQLDEFCGLLAKSAPQNEKIFTLGPAEAPLARLRGKYRRRFLIQADKNIHIQKTVAHWLGGVKIPSKIKVQIDVDPLSFL